MAFTNYLHVLPNLTNPLPLIKDRTTYEQSLPINLSIPDFDSSLEHAATNLKGFMHDYAKHKDIFDLKQRHISTVESLNNSNKNFFSSNYRYLLVYILNNLNNINNLSHLPIL